ncbi:MAG: M12 family metallo-peptidase [Flavobacterium sp.]|uniref:zinc-dependent metalloprotease n=1 Tax=Flavobacterium sp. TaxID=239 RepID=UPI0025BA4DAC|nr:zinc-dependent metalloprotease [Flavobacterium sp.]MCA1965224.1 M12 family metallo-peptidase [Flavobacterium sp.]
MKKTLLILIFSVFCGFVSNAQTEKFWKEVPNNEGIVKHKSVTRGNFPLEFKLFQLDLDGIKQALLSAPDRKELDKRGIIIALPNADGKLERFEMFEASNFDAELQAQYPNIRAYAGMGIDDKTAQVRLSFGVNSLQTMTFRANKSTEFMEPYNSNATIFSVYKKSNVNNKLPFTCLTNEEQQIADLGRNGNTTMTSDPVLRTFRLALSCTAEYANYFGASNAAQSALVLTAYNNTMTRVNGVNNRDLAIHMNIVANSTNVIFYNPATDPYSDAVTGAAGDWNLELQNTLSSSLTGPATSLAANNAAYDIGHLFGASGGGGNAGCIGCICTNDTAATDDKNKGSGFTSPADDVPSGDSFDIDYVAHEMGHQLGANHTFTHSRENNSVNYEPGGGSTIMAYAGITNFNLQNNSDDYFHAASIAQVQANMTTKTCDVETALTHGVPVVNAGADYSIPKSTPFTLTGTMTDTGGGTFTYCWEQYDEATTYSDLCTVSALNGTEDNDCVPSATKTSGAVFRSYPPSTSPSRTFPRLESVLRGSVSTTGGNIPAEFLSSVTRTLNFRLTGRDNSVGGGGGLTQFDNMVVTVANKDALSVSYPAAANTNVYAIGSTHVVTWTGTTSPTTGHQTIAGAANVDILFSNDGGLTFPYTLLSGTPNDGSQSVTLPAGVSGADCRFKVKASANIFFNISKSFAVGNYTYQTQNICTDYPFTLNAAITESADTSYPGVALTITDSYTISDANFYANVTHPNIGQFNILLMAPWQASLNTALWYNNITCTGANMNKGFDVSGSPVNCATTNDGGTFVPFSSANIAAYAGNNSAGSWKVYFKDTVVDSNVSAASFNTFMIQLCRTEQVAVLASESFGLDNFVIYPNPNSGNFNVQFSSNSNNEINIVVHDMRGREIFTHNYNNSGLFNESIQLNNVQSGIYLVTVQDGDRKEVKKIVVE